ncbi:hypothetical protein N2152v2_001516 [Parachlorella kessleri]
MSARRSKAPAGTAASKEPGLAPVLNSSNLERELPDNMNPSQLARVALLFTYVAWFALVCEPVMVKSRDLPLHYFDLLFRTFGAGLLFILWAVRAVVTYSWPKAFPRKRDTVVKPFTLYFVLSAIRGAMYQLHVGGYIFTPRRYARDNLSHPPHVMSDHILLGASLMGGFACEASLSLLHLWNVRSNSLPGLFAKGYSLAATILAALVSCECYFTSREEKEMLEYLTVVAVANITSQAQQSTATSAAVRASTPLQRSFATRRPHLQSSLIDPQGAVLYQQAITLARNADFEAARTAFEEAVSSCPQLTEAWVSWAKMEQWASQSLGEADSQRLSKCREVLQRALALNPTNAEVAQAWGLIELQCGNMAAALLLLERSVRQGRSCLCASAREAQVTGQGIRVRAARML